MNDWDEVCLNVAASVFMLALGTWLIYRVWAEMAR